MRSLALLLALTGCATGTPPNPRADAGPDARVVLPEGGPRDDGGQDAGVDAGATDLDASIDAGSDSAVDAGVDAGLDGGIDAGRDAGTDAGIDAGACGVISAGHTITLDGAGDAAEYPASQVLAPGASLGAADTFALTWDREYLYVTLVSPAFADAFKPLHVYLEARSSLGVAATSMGKEYGGHTPRFEFTPTHLIAVRRTSDSGAGGPYNGVYVPTASWSDRATPLDAGSDYFADSGTMSVRVPWTALGCPSVLRLSVHVVNAAPANEWKDLVPTSATPWGEGGSGGAYYEIDLGADPAITNWTLRP